MSLAHGEQRKCIGCDERIIGATRTDNDTIAPITALPKENGNILLWRDAQDGLPRYVVVGNDKTRQYLQALGVPLRLNHFVDCAAKAQFARAKS